MIQHGVACFSAGSRKAQVSVAAPLQSSAAAPSFGSDFYAAPNANAIIDIDKFAYVQFKALAYTPGGWVRLNEGNNSSTSVEKGGVFWGLWYTGNGSVDNGGSVSPPSSTNGDREVQFRIRSVIRSASTGDVISTVDLLTAQIGIFDNFGQTLANGFETRVWRSQW